MSEALADPLRVLADTEYDWAGSDELILDERYRHRHLPVLRTDVRAPMAADPIGPGEFWPPIRAVVLPLVEPVVHRTATIVRFLDDIRASSIGELVWWPGLELRADRMHATVAMPELPSDAALTAAAEVGPIELTVRGPWVGRYNTGRIYLPVAIADRSAQRAITALREDAGGPNRPLLSGFLQLTGDVTGPRYRELRDLIRAHQSAVVEPIRCQEIWVTDTMDDLMLRSEIVRRYRLS